MIGRSSLPLGTPAVDPVDSPAVDSPGHVERENGGTRKRHRDALHFEGGRSRHRTLGQRCHSSQGSSVIAPGEGVEGHGGVALENDEIVDVQRLGQVGGMRWQLEKMQVVVHGKLSTPRVT